MLICLFLALNVGNVRERLSACKIEGLSVSASVSFIIYNLKSCEKKSGMGMGSDYWPTLSSDHLNLIWILFWGKLGQQLRFYDHLADVLSKVTWN